MGSAHGRGLLSLISDTGGPLLSPIIGGAKAKERSLTKAKRNSPGLHSAEMTPLEGFQETHRCDKNLENLAGKWAEINRTLDGCGISFTAGMV